MKAANKTKEGERNEGVVVMVEQETSRMVVKRKGIEPHKWLSILSTKFKAPSWSWSCSRLAIPLEDAVVTMKSGAEGAIFGAVYGYLSRDYPFDIPTSPPDPFMPYYHPQAGQKFSKCPVEDSVEDVIYCKTRSMLSGLGLQNYEKNFKKGLLSDRTLPLLTDRALREVGIPPGPRLLILDHIQRSDTC